MQLYCVFVSVYLYLCCICICESCSCTVYLYLYICICVVFVFVYLYLYICICLLYLYICICVFVFVYLYICIFEPTFVCSTASPTKVTPTQLSHCSQCNDFFAARTCEYRVALCLSCLIVGASAIGSAIEAMQCVSIRSN